MPTQSFPRYYTLWKKVTIHIPELCTIHWRVMHHFLKGKYLHKVFKILLHGRFVFILSCLFIDSITYLYKNGLIDTNFIILSVTIHYYFVLLLQFFQLWILVMFQLAAVSLRYTSWGWGFVLFCILSTCLTSDPARCSRLIWTIFCSSPRICHFSKEPWLLLLENSVRKDMGNRGFWSVLPSRTSQLTAAGQILVSTDSCICTLL